MKQTLETEKLKELKKYLFRHSLTAFIAWGIFSLIGFIIFFISIRDYKFNLIALVFLIPLFFGIPLVLDQIKLKKSFNTFLEKYQKEGNIDHLVEDWTTAQKWFDDSLRTGEFGLYQKGGVFIRSYSDILCLHELIHHTNGIEDYRVLQAVINGEGVKGIAILKTKGDSKEEMFVFFKYMEEKNPDIKFGADEAEKISRLLSRNKDHRIITK